MAGITITHAELRGSSGPGTSWLVPAGWLTIAGGIATAGLGAYYTYAGLMDVDAATSLSREAYQDGSGNLDEAAFNAAFKRYDDRSQLLFKRSFILYGGGALLVTSGILMVILAPDLSDDTYLSFSPLPGGATLQTMTRF
jgi:hypothetical protein